MIKKLSLLFFICILSALSINAEVYEGSCGDNVEYSLDTSTGLLSITGTGAMTNYDYYSVPWYSNKEYVKTVEISDGVTSIGSSAFNDCEGLTSITIGNSVTSIGEDAFYYCSGLTSVTIPNSVTSIGDYAFYYCYSLTSVTIPNSVTSIGHYAFWACSGLTSVTIPNSVTSIGGGAFQYCYGLTSITIPNSVTSIGSSAFDGTAWYNNQPEGLVYAGLVAYKYKGTMPENTSITIKEGTLGIASFAFKNCSGLTSVTIPNSVTSIGNNAFDGTAWYNNQPDGLVYAGLVAYGYKGTMPANTSITIKEGTLGIGVGAFSGCSGLTSITIPNSVTSIGVGAFSGCSKLTSVTIPNSVTSIGGGAFYNCSGLTKVYCNAENVPNTNSSAFENVNLTKATLIVPGSSVAAYKVTSPWSGFRTIKDNGIYSGSCGTNVKYSLDTNTGILSITGTGAMTNYSSSSSVPWYSNRSYIKTVEISDGVTSIGQRAFDGCSGLTSITIPNSVTSIGESAFYGCSKLTSIEIPNSVTSIGIWAFASCSGLTSVTIPNSVTSIGSSAFNGTAWYNNQPNGLVYAGLVAYKYKGTMPANTSITIKEGTLGIGNDAFSGCSGLTSITIPNSVTSIGESAFWNCSKLTSVTIPNSVTSIGNWAFHDCSKLTSVTIPNSVTSIGDYAFSGCSKLTSIEIPNSVTSIGESAFWNCSKLTSVTIPNSVTSIGSNAFSGCSELAEVYCYAEQIPTTGNDVFKDSYINYVTLYVPASAVNAYKTTTPWSEFGSIVALPEPTLRGDANGDGKVNMDDATFVTNIILGTEEATEAADVNNDGTVNMPDAMFIVNKILNGKFPDEE